VFFYLSTRDVAYRLIGLAHCSCVAINDRRNVALASVTIYDLYDDDDDDDDDNDVDDVTVQISAIIFIHHKHGSKYTKKQYV